MRKKSKNRAKPRAKKAKIPMTRRGAPEAIEKRKVARIFNDVLDPRKIVDGRSARRRDNLLKRIGGESTKPIVKMQCIEDLLALGVSVPEIARFAPRPRPLPESEELTAIVKRLHKAYEFSAPTYRFVGIGRATAKAAGIGLVALVDEDDEHE